MVLICLFVKTQQGSKNVWVTFGNSGGGFLPLHRLDRHQTALRVIDKLLLLLRSLKHNNQNMKLSAHYPWQECSPTSGLYQRMVLYRNIDQWIHYTVCWFIK